MANRNITLSLPEETLRTVKILAAKRDTSVSAMLGEALESLVREDSGYEQSRREFMRAGERGFDLGTNDRAIWTRDELHER
ncbi:MAG: ribbon-helix-helix domain-containing protein [Trueperaceae bacterium]